MEVYLYPREYYVRGRRRYIVAGCVWGLLLLSILFGGQVLGTEESRIPNMQTVIAAGVFIGFSRAYWRTMGRAPHPTLASITDVGLSIGDQILPWQGLQGFGVEADEQQIIHHLVMVSSRQHLILTFVDQQERIIAFLQALQERLPQLDNIPLSALEIWMRRAMI